MKTPSFFLFGMGNRPKRIYQSGTLYAYPGYEVLYQWQVTEETILPAEYTVILTTGKGKIRIFEDERGVWLTQNEHTQCLSQSCLCLPDFSEHPHRDILRILHHEVLINIINGVPVPNFFVYSKAWYRDSAMMAMVLKHTNNLHLIRDWAASLTELYDRNNKGHEESDNLGQLLYLLAILDLKDHPLIPAAMAEAERRLENGVLTGSTDYALHPVYQTKWLKLGLEALGKDSSHLYVPAVSDSYGGLFWMDGHNEPLAPTEYDVNYPYLWWAKQHAMRQEVADTYLVPSYPISYESCASEADYEKLRHLFPDYAEARLAAPHTWHAAEMFLYLTDRF